MHRKELKDRTDRNQAERLEGRGFSKQFPLPVRQWRMKRRMQGNPLHTCTICGERGHIRTAHMEAFRGLRRRFLGVGIPGWYATTYTELPQKERRPYSTHEEACAIRASMPANIRAFEDACASHIKGGYIAPKYRELFSILRLLCETDVNGNPRYSRPEIAKRLRLKYPTYRRRELELGVLMRAGDQTLVDSVLLSIENEFLAVPSAAPRRLSAL